MRSGPVCSDQKQMTSGILGLCLCGGQLPNVTSRQRRMVRDEKAMENEWLERDLESAKCQNRGVERASQLQSS